MLVFEAKLKGSNEQYEKLDEAIRTARFVRNSCLRYWMDNKGIGKYELSAYCAVLAKDFPFANNLNSMARQASAERAWSAITRFYDNCKKNVAKKGFPRFKKHQTHGSVEYKTTGYKLSEDRQTITFSDGFKAGSFRLWGTRDLHFYQLNQIKRVRVVRRADGYYAQFLLDVERIEKREPTHKTIGLDVGLSHFYTDSDGQTIENPRHLRKSEKSLKRLGRKLSKTKKGSKNRVKRRNRLGRKHLKVSRQRKDFAVKLARCVIQSNDLVAYEDLMVRNMVKNRKLSKSISDAAWSAFRDWLEYFGKVFGVATVAVPPHYTSQNCSNCGEVVKKSLSTRTHKCHHCGFVLDRDWNAARNILELGLRTVGHTGTLNASGDIDLCLDGETPPSKPSRGKRKPKK
ncbi:MAG: IS200/IS605 family element transposase accessory protein TnpB [Nostoc sp. NMS7]|uniref:RNA-guided endonuclease InsQ/TnpB family protein n=1 Tax=Nostoc sp. NMS7 TaxID=2815391 RepID=UPI0025D102EB|nr:transposase [Nostoc sp. NMS7]MBN3949414.1 IS200/IS605 family element transposase accessory protein TnpB [Nostoc sp. NMS7]